MAAMPYSGSESFCTGRHRPRVGGGLRGMLRRLVSHSGLLYRTPVPQDDEARESFCREVEQDICHCLVRAGDTAIDVGANAGGYLQTLLDAGC